MTGTFHTLSHLIFTITLKHRLFKSPVDRVSGSTESQGGMWLPQATQPVSSRAGTGVLCLQRTMLWQEFSKMSNLARVLGWASAKTRTGYLEIESPSWLLWWLFQKRCEGLRDWIMSRWILFQEVWQWKEGERWHQYLPVYLRLPNHKVSYSKARTLFVFTSPLKERPCLECPSGSIY